MIDNPQFLDSPTKPSASRRHDLDALRAGAMVLGICLHGMMAYSGIPWVVMDNERSGVLENAINLIHGFRMPLFFLVSGYFTAMLACRRGWAGMLGNRAGRILTPLLVCMITIIPLNKTVEFLALKENASHPHGRIFEAISEEDPGKVLKILEGGPSSQIEEPEKRMRLTPLAWAVLCESEPMTRLLLEQGANPMALSQMGLSPLSTAALLGRVELIKLLLEKGGDPFSSRMYEKSAWKAADLSLNETQGLLLVSRGKMPPDLAALEQGRRETIKLLSGLSMEKYGTLVPPEPGDSISPNRNIPHWLGWYFAWLASDNNVLKLGGLEINLVQDNTLEHLWFLWFLWWLCLIYAGASWLANLTGLRMTENKSYMFPGLLVAFVLTCCLQALMNLDYHPTTLQTKMGPDFSPGFIPKPHVFLYYAIFFFFGGWYFKLGDDQCRLGKFWWVVLPLALVVIFPMILSLGEQRLPNILLQAIFTWLMTLGAMGLANKLFQKESKVFRYLADSAYWLYLAHIPVVIFMQWQLLHVQLPAWLKFMLVLLVSMPVLLASYGLLVRRTIIGRILNGKTHGKD